MCDVVRLSHFYTRDRMIAFRHDDPPDVRARICMLLRRHRGCRAGQHLMSTPSLQPFYQDTGGADDGADDQSL